MDNPSFFPLNPLNDGGPGAFCPKPGLSLRDWFAGQAVAGSDFMNCTGWSHLDLAKYAYSLADAMLLARKGDGA